MIQMIQAEWLKTKRSFIRKAIFLMPLLVVVCSILLMPQYMVSNAYNWWTIFFLPTTTALVAGLLHQQESRKLHYQGVLLMPVSLEKVWLAKLIIMMVYLFIANSIFLIAIIAGQWLVTVEGGQFYPNSQLVFANIVMFHTTLWGIPCCMLLAKRFGIVITVCIHTIFGGLMAILCSTSNWWWICPYAWMPRAIIPILRVLPSGLLLEETSSLTDTTVIAVAILFTWVATIGLTHVTKKWFSKQEVER